MPGFGGGGRKGEGKGWGGRGKGEEGGGKGGRGKGVSEEQFRVPAMPSAKRGDCLFAYCSLHGGEN